jgi:hypothetical protein
VFSGSQFLEKTSFTLGSTAAATCFIVMKFDSLTGSQIVLGIGSEGESYTASRRFVIRKSSDNSAYCGINDAGKATIPVADTSVCLISSVYNKTVNRIFNNGEEVDSEAYSTSIGAHDALRIGKALYTLDPNYFLGRISEIVYFSRVLSDDEISLVNAYLMEKWGLV